ncbi:S-layer homology domain-containing protein [Paenibacillus sp.]|uniref:S-layer homology domain-containing protein n=1 Tax=Paenibacillus sp. TaxID=58172 RepID=UPI0028121921|nr:S-layer homology domain-containing protein [Paenibacillus sp.]
MKKGLSLLLAASVAFSAFSATAFAAEPQTAQEKYDALVEAGIFEGFPDGEAHLDENMTRAQAAKIVAMVLGLEEDAAAASIYTDLKDAEWAAGFIGAATEAGVLEGRGNGVFDPSANVTVQELAKIMVEALDIEVDAEATVEGADEWAAAYVAAAVAAGLIPEQDDYTAPASRTILVEASYSAYAQTNVPDVASVKEAKATGVYKVQVTLDKEVDTAKATLTLKKGASTVTTKTVWGEDKKSATLELSTRITAGEYSVTLGGLDSSAVGTTVASFTAEDEKVTKIDFVNSNDTLPYSDHAAIELVAENQYEEAVSLAPSNFTALVSGTAVTMTKNDDGTFTLPVDTKRDGVSQGNGLIPVTVYYNASTVTVSKNFKVGTVPLLSKVEAGEVKYSNTTTKKLSVANDVATIPLTLYDQYGNKLVKAQLDGATPEVVTNINPVVTPFDQKFEFNKNADDKVLLFDDNGNAKLELKVTAKMDKNGEYTVNIYGGASSATATVSVGAAKVATKFEFDVSGVTLAANDDKVIVPIIAYDANGEQLTAQEIADSAADNRFSLTAPSNATVKVLQTGTDKGKLEVKFTGTGPVYNQVNTKVFLSGQINNAQTNTFVQTNITVSDFRTPESFKVDNDLTPKAILGAGDDFVLKLQDAHGQEVKNIPATIEGANGQTSSYRVFVEVTASGDLTVANVTPKGTGITADAGATATKKTFTFTNGQFEEFNKGFAVTSSVGDEGKVTIKATVQKKGSTGDFSNYSSSVSRTFEAIKSDADLTYSLKTIGDLYAAIDKLDAPIEGSVGASQFDKKIEVVAKDSAGNEVKLPENFVKDISSSNPSVVVAGPDVGTPPKQDGYVLGNKAGTATVTAIVYTNKGNTVNLTQEVTVKADQIVVEKLEADKKSKAFDAAIVNAIGYFEKIKVTDQYGIAYESNNKSGSDAKSEISTYDSVLGLRYTVKVVNGTGAVTVDPKSGAIDVGAIPTTVKEFEITATAPNGKSVTVLVSRP